jgi:hypothetical protein
MIERAVILSLQITAIYMLFQEGMILGWLRIKVANALDRRFGLVSSKYIQKPVWDCLTCMAGIWTIVLTLSFNWKLILAVCGMNSLIDKLLSYEGNIEG